MEQLTGRVTRANGKGFEVEGRWLHISRYADDVAPPAVGDQVAVELDARGFVRSVSPLPAVHGSLQGGNAPATAANGQATGVALPPAIDRETAITRMAALNTSVSILGGGPGHPVDPAEVVALAGRLVTWIQRSPEPRS